MTREEKVARCLARLINAIERKADIGKRRDITVSPLMEEIMNEGRNLLEKYPLGSL